MSIKRAIVTGGAGFIGSALCRYLVGSGGYAVVNLDKLTYAANPASLADLSDRASYRMVVGAITGETLPVYGQGKNVRDWLYVEDHARALVAVAEHGRIGESYNIGGRSERANIDVVKQICLCLDRRRPMPKGCHADRIA